MLKYRKARRGSAAQEYDIRARNKRRHQFSVANVAHDETNRSPLHCRLEVLRAPAHHAVNRYDLSTTFADQQVEQMV